MSARRSRTALRRREYTGPARGPRARSRLGPSPTTVRQPATPKTSVAPPSTPVSGAASKRTKSRKRPRAEVFSDSESEDEPIAKSSHIDSDSLVNSIVQNLKDTLIPSITEAVKQDVLASLQAAGIFPVHQQPTTATGQVISPVIGQEVTMEAPALPATVSVNSQPGCGGPSVPSLALGMLPLHTQVSALEGATSDSPHTLFHSRAIPIDLHVSDDIRTKIAANKYIDLDCLVPKTTISNKIPEAGTFQLVDGVLKVVPSSKARRIKSIEGWCSAFNVYITIYTRVHTSEMAHLLQYVETIKSLAADGADWYFYDQNFRYCRAQCAAAYPWHSINWELHMTAKSKGQSNTLEAGRVNMGIKKQPFRKPGYPGLPRGTCHRFHRGLGCHALSCPWTHECFKCRNGKHPAYRCTAKRESSQKPPSSAKAPHAGKSGSSK